VLPLQRTVADKYPFAQVRGDARLADVELLFHPQTGDIAKFRDKELSAYVQVNGHQVTAAPLGSAAEFHVSPAVVDLLPGVPYNQQIANCCRGGVVSAYGQDPSASVAAFQISVGQAGTTNRTVKVPKNFTLLGPGPGYTCGPAKVVPSTVFLTADHRRKTQALSTS
jgi:hypothetical protein